MRRDKKNQQLELLHILGLISDSRSLGLKFEGYIYLFYPLSIVSYDKKDSDKSKMIAAFVHHILLLCPIQHFNIVNIQFVMAECGVNI